MIKVKAYTFVPFYYVLSYEINLMANQFDMLRENELFTDIDNDFIVCRFLKCLNILAKPCLN